MKTTRSKTAARDVAPTDPHAEYLKRLQRAEAMAEQFADRMFASAALSLHEIDEMLVEGDQLEQSLFQVLLGGPPPETPDDDRRLEQMAMYGDAHYIMGVAVGRRLGRKVVR